MNKHEKLEMEAYLEKAARELNTKSPFKGGAERIMKWVSLGTWTPPKGQQNEGDSHKKIEQIIHDKRK